MTKPTISRDSDQASQVATRERANGLAVPQHIAFIMDGNGRWAQQQGLPRLEGHRAGTKNVHRILEALDAYGVRYATLYAFSTENWSRPSAEVNGLMRILQEAVERETPSLHKQNVRVGYLGRLDRLSATLRNAINNALELTGGNTGLTLSVAFDYGGRDELIQAIQKIVRDGIPAEEINGELLQSYLYTPDLPDPDLIVRTAGEQRLSNFMTWQSVYSEYYCSPVFWPDFDEAELARVLHSFSKRNRNFGALATEK